MKKPFLARGIIRELKDFGKIPINSIVESIGWSRKSVYDELRRIKNMTVLGLWINETRTKKDMYFELHPIMRNGATVDCMYEMTKQTFKFNSSIQERI